MPIYCLLDTLFLYQNNQYANIWSMQSKQKKKQFYASDKKAHSGNNILYDDIELNSKLWPKTNEHFIETI